MNNRGIKARVLVVDDHAVVRRGLTQILNDEPDFAVCGEADSADAAMSAISELKPDVVIVDLTMIDTNGLELIKRIGAQWPELPVMMLTMHHESLYSEQALRAGAKGYVMKHEPIEVLINALRRVISGHLHVPKKLADKMATEGIFAPGVSPIASLTVRELEVLRTIGQGISTRKIAETLNMSLPTVSSHCEHIKDKLNVKSMAELFRLALHWIDQGVL